MGRRRAHASLLCAGLHESRAARPHTRRWTLTASPPRASGCRTWLAQAREEGAGRRARLGTGDRGGGREEALQECVPVEDGGAEGGRPGGGRRRGGWAWSGRDDLQSASRRRAAAGRMSVERTGQPWWRAGGAAPVEFRAPARRAALRASFRLLPDTQGRAAPVWCGCCRSREGRRRLLRELRRRRRSEWKSGTGSGEQGMGT